MRRGRVRRNRPLGVQAAARRCRQRRASLRPAARSLELRPDRAVVPPARDPGDGGTGGAGGAHRGDLRLDPATVGLRARVRALSQRAARRAPRGRGPGDRRGRPPACGDRRARGGSAARLRADPPGATRHRRLRLLARRRARAARRGGARRRRDHGGHLQPRRTRRRRTSSPRRRGSQGSTSPTSCPSRSRACAGCRTRADARRSSSRRSGRPAGTARSTSRSSPRPTPSGRSRPTRPHARRTNPFLVWTTAYGTLCKRLRTAWTSMPQPSRWRRSTRSGTTTIRRAARNGSSCSRVAPGSSAAARSSRRR